MQTREFLRLFVRLCNAYPRQRITDGTREEYQRALSELDAKAVEISIDVWIRSEPFFPSISDLVLMTNGTHQKHLTREICDL
jgi:hypothetical protein